MQHEDAEVSDLVVILKQECAEKFDDTVAALKRMGMEIESTDPDDGEVEGTIGADKVGEIRKWECVQYVRVDFTYIADYPPGDPRNQDPSEAVEEDSGRLKLSIRRLCLGKNAVEPAHIVKLRHAVMEIDEIKIQAILPQDFA